MADCFVCGQSVGKRDIRFYDGRSLHKCCLEQALDDLNRDILLTSTHQIEGYRIVEYVEVISGETVIGTGLFSELDADLADISGRESMAFKGKLGGAKKMALQRLRGAALALGANAVVGVDLDYATLTGNKIAVVASGTAVTIE
jgi:uncharacterized protein YbjQ (UPF0145 family)